MKQACKANLPALIFLFALLILWQTGAMGMDAAYILPSPTQILAKLWELRVPLFTVHLPATMLVTAIGLGISLVLGLALAVVMDTSDMVRRMIYPIVVVSQTKDFSECVVYISNDSITVAVPAPAEGLSEEAVARITDVICTETEYDASQLNIIEVKA